MPSVLDAISYWKFPTQIGPLPGKGSDEQDGAGERGPRLVRPELAAARRRGAARPVLPGLAIGVEGAPCQHLYIIVAGQVLLSRRDARGEDSARYLLGTGDLFGEGALLPGRRWVMTARPVTDGAAHVLPAAQLARLSQVPIHS